MEAGTEDTILNRFKFVTFVDEIKNKKTIPKMLLTGFPNRAHKKRIT